MKVLKFGAVWCPSCLTMRPIWKKVLSETKDIDITEYDYDLDEEMIEKYNVGDKLPVVIKIDDSGKEIARLIGEKKEEELLDFIRE